MVATLAFGVVFASVITLLIVPAAYLLLDAATAHARAGAGGSRMVVRDDEEALIEARAPEGEAPLRPGFIQEPGRVALRDRA
jgi:hypothetical protein